MQHSISLQTLETLRQRIEHLYQELADLASQLNRLENSVLPPPAEEFFAAYPKMQVGDGLFALVGTQPIQGIEHDKIDLQTALAAKFE